MPVVERERERAKPKNRITMVAFSEKDELQTLKRSLIIQVRHSSSSELLYHLVSTTGNRVSH